MDKLEKASRLEALAERSSHVENVLRHAFLADLASEVWRDDPNEPLGISNAEVDDSGYDVILERNATIRRIQLKQTHDEKTPKKFSVRVEFATYPGACIVVIAHSLLDLRPTSYSFYGSSPDNPMPYIEAHRTTKAPGRRTADGKRILRLKYRDVPFSRFKRNLSMRQLLDELFPGSGVHVHV
ncbi:MAG TPA: hypothetical protein VFB20_10015 [Burkholderiales bacterium]|nr:hypothetical protein [Burkholderiales bacterium]